MSIPALAVTVQVNGEKRLILDLRLTDLHVHKQKFKGEELHTIKNIFAKGIFVFSFDLKSGYHHIDIFPDRRKYLPFSWEFVPGHTRFFQFTVLPFELSSAPYKPLETHWRVQFQSPYFLMIALALVHRSFQVAKLNSSLLSFKSFLLRI